MRPRICELCNGEAALYCASDSAFLCWSCDARVHEANFLVARHVRRTLCSKCDGFAGNSVAGVGLPPRRSICASCSMESPYDDDVDSDSSSSSSACVSSSSKSFAAAPKKADADHQRTERVTSPSSVTEVSGPKAGFPAKSLGEVASLATAKTQKRSEARTRTLRGSAPSKAEAKLEGVLVNWCTRLGLSGSCTSAMVASAMGACLCKLTVLPLRASLAAALWFSLRACVGASASTWQNLRRLEDVSGVPAKLILAAASRLARASKIEKSTRRDQEEGWAECSA
ncbi:B-box zinc finger protein 32 [Malania oleifera]|uniref:B-box zinc finger protein 32 n=1 Tax=Malania oleifera TaxID=397392 RepID=UPI0025AE345A|nr:B-box zinc finger protein 32 [Malania oleifera]